MEKQVQEEKKTLTFPLNSRRLLLSHKQLIAKALSLPTTASASDLAVMIDGKFREENRNPTDIQVIVIQSEKGEELLLKDVDGVFLKIPADNCASSRTSPTPSSQVSSDQIDFLALQGNDTFQFEEDCLERVLDSMEQELVKTRTQLYTAEEEVMSLRLRLSEYSDRIGEAETKLKLERIKVQSFQKRKKPSGGNRTKLFNYGMLTANNC